MTMPPVSILENALVAAQARLAEFASNEAFELQLTASFGTLFDRQDGVSIQQALADGTYNWPKFQVASQADLQGAYAAYAAESQTVYVSDAFLEANAATPEAIVAVLLEEIGHDIDTVLNKGSDAAGDEGAIFSAFVRAQPLNENQLQQLKLENDHATIQVNGVDTAVEMATVITGSTGGSQSFDNRQPYGTLNYAIALQGIFPPRGLSADTALTSGDSTPYIGEIIQFAGNFAPRGYALCDGQILSIAQNTALFSILGTTYGGNGQTTFALPDLRGRTPIGVGTGPGLTSVALGESSGTESVVLTQSQMPSHAHVANGSPTSVTGGSQPYNTAQPTLGLTPVITLEGIYGDLGHIGWFAGNFAPVGHAIADGQLLPIDAYSALFSLIGTTYGGDGQTTFALPDLRGRIAVDDGTTHPLGSAFGAETVTLTIPDLPAHTHTTSSGTTTSIGGAQPFSNVQPSLALSFEIATQGIFPSRNLQAEPGVDTPNTSGSEVSGLFASEGVLSVEAAIATIEKLAQESIARWQAAGISADQIAQLQGIRYEIADLAPGYLAVFQGDVITIDADASNTRWFIDSTPGEDEEFLSIDPVTGELYATDARAVGSFDLLTTILHEQGHGLGFNHTSSRGSVMFGSLGKGGRLVPTAQDRLNTVGESTGSAYFTVDLPMIAEVAIFAGADVANQRDSLTSTSGQILPIGQNQALFSLLGTNYGGNGQTNFALPDFRDRAVVHVGQGQGLSSYVQGQIGGSETVTLTTNQMPTHTHTYTTNTNPDAVNDTPTTNEDTSVTLNVLVNDTDLEGDAISLESFTTPSNGTVTLNDNGTVTKTDDTLIYAPNQNFNGTDSFTYSVSDGNGGTDTATVTITVTAVNDAPSLSDTAVILSAVDEDAGAPSGVVGTLVSQLVSLSTNVSDPDAGAVTGIAIISANTTQGSWFYSINNGATWLAMGAVATNTAQLLAADANARLYFQPNANYNGTLANALAFHAWDQTSGANGGTADLSSTGSPTAFSTSTDTASITITAVNDAPSFSKGADPIILEDAGAQTVTNWATAISKGPADEASQVLTFSVSNNNNALFSVQPSIDPATGTLTYTPAAATNGTATVTVQLQDDGSGTNTSAPQTFTITVLDNDITHSVSAIAGTIPEGNSGSTPVGLFTITRTGVTTESSSVNFTLTGTAITGVDYTSVTVNEPGVSLSGNTITFAANATTATLNVNVLGDVIDEGTDESIGITLSNPVALTAGYEAAIATSTATRTITDDDTAGFSLNKISATVGESGTTDSLTVVLTSQPQSNVVLSLVSSDLGEATASPTTLTFSPNNWNTAQTVTITGVNDVEQDGNQTSTLTVSVVDASSDDVFDAIANQSVSVTTIDNDGVAGVFGTPTPAIQFPNTPTANRIVGTPGNDVLRGSPKSDRIEGRGGNDKIVSGWRSASFGQDRLFGGAGNDILLSGKGKDYLDGGSGDDRIKGGSNRDLCVGGTGNDQIWGQRGDDILIGGVGNDSLMGGAGKDMFVYESLQDGTDTIRDFDRAQDVIDLRPIFRTGAFSNGSDFERFNQYVQLVDTGGSTEIRVDADGSGAGTNTVTLAVVSGVTGLSSIHFVVS